MALWWWTLRGVPGQQPACGPGIRIHWGLEISEIAQVYMPVRCIQPQMFIVHCQLTCTHTPGGPLVLVH